MNKIIIGINQRIPISILEMALYAVLQDSHSPAYFAELASREYNGSNRIKKSVSILNKLTEKNPLMDFLKNHKEVAVASLRNKNDRALLFTALICAAYPFGYDTTALLGKYFHVQDQVSSALIVQKMAGKYGSNRSLPNALYSVLPMLIEAGIITRPVSGLYEMVRVKHYSNFVYEVYQRSFIVNNPTYTLSDEIESNSYFEFVN